MRVAWEYPLPLTDQNAVRDFDLESPIGVRGSELFFALIDFDETQRTRHWPIGTPRLNVHRISHLTGRPQSVCSRTLESGPQVDLPRNLAFLDDGNRTLLFANGLFDCGESLRELGCSRIRQVATELHPGRPMFLIDARRLYFTDSKFERLCRYEMASETMAWQTAIQESARYRCEPPQWFGTQLVTYGRNGLVFVDPNDGEIQRELKLPKIEKLYSPIDLKDDWLIGWTGWSVGGVVRYSPKTDQIVWRFKKRCSDPALYGRIWHVDDVVIWVKASNEIVGIDVVSGKERWSFPTKPWLYSPIKILDGQLIFGTAGADGFLQSVNASTGKANWSVFLKNGCSYFDVWQESVVVGDFDRIIRQIDLTTGKEMDRIVVDAPVVGDMKVIGDMAVTTIWLTDNKPPRIVGIELT